MQTLEGFGCHQSKESRQSMVTWNVPHHRQITYKIILPCSANTVKQPQFTSPAKITLLA
ncbi:hypothetical protein B0T14DRAFT_522154 [Immersiella caudata]|uniref:Uncharacterized protein n=1 Tax=Immersiella caudata TaxID=314043 RepID=A0AA39WSI9_9PEZI|nr:hypothetical protein B0T14DRAFT_522154 [Immersiella caudata]